ncbi:hypothetical protein ACH5RR_007064 [Cinchona calisaya]|uniref:Retrotransposon Copia-like N-terminal domain-containing protein n=1 Tax=Cinchona calisaya TaxID=153742 RepID=A0ABD3AQQ7_9GENT
MASESRRFSGPSSGQESVNSSGTDGSVLLITQHNLIDHNYFQWAKSMMMFILGKGQNFLSYDSANEIWTGARKTCFDNDNIVELFEIKGAFHDFRQGRYKKIVEKERIFQVLLGLDKSLMKSGKEFLEPSLFHEFMRLSHCSEEREQEEVNDGNSVSSSTPSTQEGLAFVSQGTNLNSDARPKKW